MLFGESISPVRHLTVLLGQGGTLPDTRSTLVCLPDHGWFLMQLILFGIAYTFACGMSLETNNFSFDTLKRQAANRVRDLKTLYFVLP